VRRLSERRRLAPSIRRSASDTFRRSPAPTSPARPGRCSNPLRRARHDRGRGAHARSLLARLHERARLGHLPPRQAGAACAATSRHRGTRRPQRSYASARSDARARRARTSRRGGHCSFDGRPGTGSRGLDDSTTGRATSRGCHGSRLGGDLRSRHLREPCPRSRPGRRSRGRHPPRSIAARRRHRRRHQPRALHRRQRASPLTA
jgi:hypothetical protein